MNEEEIISQLKKELKVELPRLTHIKRGSLGYISDQRKVVGLGLSLSFHRIETVDLRMLSNLRELWLSSPNEGEYVSILVDGLEKMTRFSTSMIMFKNPSFIENLKALNHLDVIYSNVDFEAVRGLKKLNSLMFDECMIQDISPLSDLEEITHLDLKFNSSSFQDISPLKNLNKLEYLNLNGTGQINDISPLSQLIRLKYIDIGQHKVHSIDVLKNLKALRTLKLEYNQITDLSPIEKLSQLTELDVGGNEITNLKPVQALIKLEVLIAHGNRIENVAPLENLANLAKLRLENNAISDITPLIPLVLLKELKLNGNKISRFPIELAYSVDDKSGITGNPLVEPPSEISATGGQAIVDYYHKEEAQELVSRNKNSEINGFLLDVLSVVQKLRFTIRMAQLNGVDVDTTGQYEKAAKLLKETINQAVSDKIEVNYLEQFKPSLSELENSIPYVAFNDQYKSHSSQQKAERIQEAHKDVSTYYNEINKQLAFFRSIGFFRRNAVLVGANGSGKTSLSNAFRKYLHRDSIVISSQRIMRIPHFDGIVSAPTSTEAFKQVFTRDRSVVDEKEFTTLQQEFTTVLRKLSADNAHHKITHYESSEREKTTLDRCLALWNGFNSQRQLVCEDGINIVVKASGSKYSVAQMSDGEKAILYLISLILLAPSQSIVVVDEPEMHLHRTIIDSFWDTLEAERKDCLFIYLTHDLDFATSRTNAEKIWIKSFSYPERWETEAVPKNDIPEALLLELLGSRKNILFCEGNDEGYDKRIYTALFPNFTVTPVRTSSEVVKYTKAFNSVPKRITNTAAYGLIDADYHHPSTLKAWEGKRVYGLLVSELENLFLDSTLLELMGVQSSAIDKIKGKVEREFKASIENQASKFASRKLTHHFREEKIEERKTLEEVEKTYEDFLSEVDVKTWYQERVDCLSTINSYDHFIRLYEGKNLVGAVSVKIDNRTLKAKKFKEYAVQFIEDNEEGRECLYRHFPPKIKNKGT